jgi:MFS family permease
VSFGYKNYLLTLLAVIVAFNGVDGVALSLLLQNIKLDLSLSDTQLGVLTGIAYALFYSIMGIPIARWADRGNRIVIIAITTALWSAAVALCGFAASFVQLMLIRVAIGVGEAGCIPPAHSLIADHFTRAERPRAVSRYMLGGSLGAFLGYFAAGWLNELYGWRMTFVLLGLPGLLLALIAWFSLKEPRASKAHRELAYQAPAYPHKPQLGFMDVCALLWRSVAFRHLLLCFSVVAFFGNGMLKWQPAFFMRSFGMQTGELGTWLAVVYGCSGLLGTVLGGELTARYAANNERLQLKAIAILYGALMLVKAATYLATNKYLALGLAGLHYFCAAASLAPIFATIQTLVPARMRATALAIVYLFSHLIGAGMGPFAAGAISDALRPIFAQESLRYALLALSPGYLWAARHVWRASTTVAKDIETARSAGDEDTCSPTERGVTPEFIVARPRESRSHQS